MSTLVADILQRPDIIFPARVAPLPNILACSNEAEFNPAWDHHIRTVAYAARATHFGPLILGLLPQTVHCIGEACLLVDGNDAVSDRLPHALRGNPAALAEQIARPREIVEIATECFLLGRYGTGTWGHWLGEIVPVAAVVERAFPGRFRYATPVHRGRYGDIQRQSLHAYGITADRLIEMRHDATYVFQSAWTLTPIWTDHAPHPAALDIMRGAVQLGAYRPGLSRIILDRSNKERELIEAEGAYAMMRSAGFVRVSPADLDFVDQVRLFQGASDIVSVIGSGLTGLIYSPDRVRVLGLAPASWGDRFFYALGQHRNAAWSEVRGQSCGEDRRIAPFSITLAAVQHGFDAAFSH